jgi:hypothetical protein
VHFQAALAVSQKQLNPEDGTPIMGETDTRPETPMSALPPRDPV